MSYISHLGAYSEGRRDGVAHVVTKVRAVIEEFKSSSAYKDEDEAEMFVASLEECIGD